MQGEMASSKKTNQFYSKYIMYSTNFTSLLPKDSISASQEYAHYHSNYCEKENYITKLRKNNIHKMRMQIKMAMYLRLGQRSSFMGKFACISL